MSVGGPQSLRLDSWAREVREFFADSEIGGTPYLVGSAAEDKQWRDVDVVVIIGDDEFEAMFGTRRPPFSTIGKWAAFCAAFSAWGTDRADPVILAALARWRDATGGGE